MSTSITVGANLTPVTSIEARALSLALTEWIEKLHLATSQADTLYGGRPEFRVFTKAGAPVTDTSADSPGQDLCFVYDTTNHDLYLISGWSAAGTFTATAILSLT